ncbi:transposase family protein [Microcoleus sp. N3A4]|uniref:transposase family protein n=1 Tax=Microcoleus sp. N3A4 TaxID=3055379 RepID=UPI002FD0F781
MDVKRRHTQRYEQDIYERVKQSSMEQIVREEGLSYDEIKGIFEQVNTIKKNLIGNGLNEFVWMR